MRKITSLSQLRALLKNDVVIIKVLPYGGKGIIKKYCKDCIEIPNEFNSVEELQNWRDFLNSKSTYKVIGRSYVIDLLFGKTKLGQGNLKVSGNVFTISAYKAINYVVKRVDKDVSKILDYSILTLHGYYTYIPGLLVEGVKLAKENKIDDALKTFNKFRRILYINENEAKSPEELLKKVYKGNNLREDWEKLSPIWREIIYYLIDSSLGLLPGESKRQISDLNYSSTEVEELSIIDYLEYVDIVNLAISELFRGNNVAIIGSLRTGKSTISELIKKRAKDHKLEISVIDYHNTNNEYTSLEKIYNSNKSKVLYVLTNDLAKTLGINAFKIYVDRRYIYSLSRDKGLTLRLDERITSIPMHYIIMYQTDNIESTLNEALENFYADYWNYIYNVIFDSDPNKILWYSPILAVYDKYNIPIPVRISALILKNSGRKNVNENDLILKWFSNCNIPFKVPKSEDYYTDSLDSINVEKILANVAEEISKEINNETMIDSILNILSYLSITEGEKPRIISKIKEYFDNNFNFMRIFLPYIIERLKDNINIEKYCKELSNNSLQPYELLAKIKGILMKSTEDKCTSTALDILLTLSKNGKVEWVRFVLDDIINNIKVIKKNYSYQLSAILFNYLKYSNEDIDKVKQIINEIDNEYSVFPKSLVNYIDGSLDLIQFTNPLWSVLIYGFLGIYSLTNHDLLKLALIYDKFRKNYALVKNSKYNLDDLHLKDFFPISNDIMDYIDELKDRLDAGIGYTLLLTHPREESVRATIELSEKLVINWYNRIRNKMKEGKIKNNEAIDLLKFYQIKLMKSLVSGGKYEYKSVLQDIIELEKLTDYVKEQDVKGSLLVASSISKKVLGIEEKPRIFSGTTLDLLIYISAEILLGANDKNKFFDFIANQIKNKDEGIDKALVGIITAVMKNDKKELDKALEYAKENYYSAMLEILSKYVNDRKMFVVSLIPYIGFWHFLGG
ncbi:hypothetical protein SJAV_10820 [Sulfurisphaera javensis]|uniref:Uncharacterized protein n=1 Tax=Sulfurisphaera javensis TaxID=2049879 RepID=A0AAT9GQE8_9CREN